MYAYFFNDNINFEPNQLNVFCCNNTLRNMLICGFISAYTIFFKVRINLVNI